MDFYARTIDNIADKINARFRRGGEKPRRPRGFIRQPRVRPSSGGATPKGLSASHLSSAIRPSYDAAPEDGRAPGRLLFCRTALFASLGLMRCLLAWVL